MHNLKAFLITALVCLAITPGAREQHYNWQITHQGLDSNYRYVFTAIDCFGEVCTAAGEKQNTSKLPFTNTIMFFRSTNGGVTWAEQDPGLPVTETSDPNFIQQVEQIDSLNAFGAADSGLVVRTTDGGNTWVREDLPLPDSLGTFYLGSFHFSDPMTGIVTLFSTVHNIYTTSDGGETWNLSPWYPWLPATMCHSDGGEAFRAITHENGPLYITSDDWEAVDSTPLIFSFGLSVGDTGSLEACNFLGMDTLVGYGVHWTDSDNVLISGDSPLIMTSVDDGGHWANAYTSGDVQQLQCMSNLDRDIVFCGGVSTFPHILYSTDHGMTWAVDTIALNGQFPQTVSGVAVTSNDNAVAILGGTLGDLAYLVRGTPATATVKLNDVVSNDMQIYPNPASESLTVSSSNAGELLQVLDVLSREVMHCVIPLNGTLTLNVSSLPSGIYYVTDGATREKFVKE
jgi:hypothetical protein